MRSADGVSLLRLRRAFAKDLGETWDTLPIQQQLLVDQAGIKALVLEKMATFALSRGALTEDGRPVGALGSNYLAWSNSLRHDLLALGLERRMKQVMDLRTLLTQPREDAGREGAKGPADG
jgi:hypothetical protein